jgi:hypothetical protein
MSKLNWKIDTFLKIFKFLYSHIPKLFWNLRKGKKNQTQKKMESYFLIIGEPKS